tara:strand:- start:876 stop:1868 length:993 start_codon:yes stop_codon:yes gene_type:complete
MIIKNYELNKIDMENYNLFLFYGENEGYKNEIIDKLYGKLANYKKIKYVENEVLENLENFISEILNKSLFEEKKFIIINRATDKLINLINQIITKEIIDCKIILISEILQKKSKIRMSFEKEKRLVCVPFYNDNNGTLSSLANNFLRDKKINISQENLNLIVERSSGDRINLYNELIKIETFCENRKNITYNDILTLTNLADDYSISEIIDNCLAKNLSKIVTILNENNFTLEDCIIILRTFLYKSKRLLKLINDFEISNDAEKSINSYRPLIFWKEKEILKNQIRKWSKNEVMGLISEIYEIEVLVKKHTNNSLNIVCDFILNKSKTAH